jgi:hypothetical protein
VRQHEGCIHADDDDVPGDDNNEHGRHDTCAGSASGRSDLRRRGSKTVTLTVDRYEVVKGGRRAVVDLGTPVGVDNVDAYRMMIESLRLQ